jgi:hypothetical protein
MLFDPVQKQVIAVVFVAAGRPNGGLGRTAI